MTFRGSLTVKGQFIDDLDPYDGKTMPMPLVEESDTDSVWQEFQSITSAEETDKPEINPRMQKP